MAEMNPGTAAVFAELDANPELACVVNFAALGFHAHISANGEGAYHVEMHTTVQSMDDTEEVLSVDHALTAGEVDFKMTMLSMLDDSIMETLVAESHIGDEAEDFLRNLPAGE